MDSLSKLAVHFAKKQFVSVKGPFKYYVSKEVGGWGQKMAIFAALKYHADVGGWA